MKKRLLAFAALSLAFLMGAAAEKITVQKDAGGWRLFDGTKPVEVKGIVWSYTPIGETHTYDLFGKDEAFIRRMIDTDMPMLKSMGVNVIRCFSTIPAKWVEYIYTKYGIYTVINDLLGRYGVSVRGTWYGQTDYSDQYTREVLIEQAKKTAESYKGVKGVLMYMFGNESNYGLVWSSTEIENLPTGEQNVVKAGYLYDLLEKAMAACKEIDPDRPVGIVNGDTQYLDLIHKLCPSLDILGVNAYRGYKFYDSFYENIADVVDKPVMLTESGADAFNDLMGQEDQLAQMNYLKSQWEEIYQQAYGKGKSQNIIGGFVFEWMDEWWKRYQNKNLDVHDDASWSNAGYDVDYADGKNNMSEEWFGIVAQSPVIKDGINMRVPRAAYYMLCDAWKLSLYDSSLSQVNQTFASLPYSMYVARGNEKTIKQRLNEQEFVKITQLDASVQAVTPVYVTGLKDDIKNKDNWKRNMKYPDDQDKTVEPKVSAEATLGLTVKPWENFTGDITFKAWNAEPYTNLADHWAMYYTKDADAKEENLKHAAVYSADFNYTGSVFDVAGYYHVGHASFEGYGDPFCISKEAYDIIGYDMNNSAAPIALEFKGKGRLAGLDVIGGPEVWGYSKPQILANYFKWLPNVGPLDGIVLNATYAEEFGASKNVNYDPRNGFGPGRKASVYTELYYGPWLTVKLGALHAGSEKLGAKYIKKSGGIGEIEVKDTLGAFGQIGTNMFQHAYIYVNGIYRGLVADTNAAAVRGSFFTADSGSGNRIEIQGGVDAAYGNFVLKPIFRMRMPIEDSCGRNLLSGAPFVVGMGNRRSLEVEAVLTYDPEGATWFHEWNSSDIEGANFAISLTGFYQAYAGKTDNLPFKSNTKTEGKNNDGTSIKDFVWYDGGNLPLQYNLWTVGTRVVTNPIANLRLVGSFTAGRLGSTTGSYKETREFVNFVRASLAARYNKWIVSGSIALNDWGTENWWRDFNRTFPLQYTFDVAYGFKKPSFLDKTNRIGVKVVGRTFDKYSSDAYHALPNGAKMDGAHYMELTTYFNIGL